MRAALAVVMTILLVASGAILQAQDVIVHSQPVHVRHFAGTVVDSRGMTVEYATVELRDAKTHRVLASTFADGRGAFSFDDRKYGKRIEIRAFQKGFEPAQYTLMLRPFADERMRVVLTVAH